MAELVVVAQVVVKGEYLEGVKRELLGLVAPTRGEAGCIEYTLHQDLADPCLFVFYERWESEEHLAAHMASPHFSAYLAAVDGKIAEKTVRRLVKIG